MDRDVQTIVATGCVYLSMLGMIAILFGYLATGVTLIVVGGGLYLSNKARVVIAFLIYGSLHHLR